MSSVPINYCTQHMPTNKFCESIIQINTKEARLRIRRSSKIVILSKLRGWRNSFSPLTMKMTCQDLGTCCLLVSDCIYSSMPSTVHFGMVSSFDVKGKRISTALRFPLAAATCIGFKPSCGAIKSHH